jgi:hypothetical protein
MYYCIWDHLCCLLARVIDYRSRRLGSIPGNALSSTYLERSPLSLVTTRTYLDERLAAPV